MVRDYKQSRHPKGTDLGDLGHKRLMHLVKAVNKGRGTRATEDGRQKLVKYVLENCACVH